MATTINRRRKPSTVPSLIQRQSSSFAKRYNNKPATSSTAILWTRLLLVVCCMCLFMVGYRAIQHRRAARQLEEFLMQQSSMQHEFQLHRDDERGNGDDGQEATLGDEQYNEERGDDGQEESSGDYNEEQGDDGQEEASGDYRYREDQGDDGQQEGDDGQDNGDDNNIRRDDGRSSNFRDKISKNSNGKQDVVSTLEQRFDRMRGRLGGKTKLERLLIEWQEEADTQVRTNFQRPTPRWIRPYLLPGVDTTRPTWEFRDSSFFRAHRHNERLDWQDEYDELLKQGKLDKGPPVDYTKSSKYVYPDLLQEPNTNGYPQLKTLRQLMDDWPQDQDFTGTIHETLLHFNYSDPVQRQTAQRFRDAKLPFKLYDVPEITRTSQKWTDDYVSRMFGTIKDRANPLQRRDFKLATGTAQESLDNYFAFHVPERWHVPTMGLPPFRNTDMDYQTWAKHAKYADAVALSAHRPHFYFQAGVPASERHARHKSDQTLISRDLEETLSTATENFFVFNIDSQKGIQCRFGERGVVAATHFDGGRNMIAMLKGAKRYVLSPPNQCGKMGIFKDRSSPIYRHSLLNFGHMAYIDDEDNDMSDEERDWLRDAGQAQAIETVLKEGEVLYLPSHWFHYIISVQKSAQCNVRSGVDKEGHVVFGGLRDVQECE